MYFGHIAVGLAVRPLAPKVPLGVLLVSATAIDSLTAVFMVVGLERPGPGSSIAWSHGLVMASVWSLAAFALASILSHDRKTGLLIGLMVFGHWLLDFISHPMHSTVPDLPLAFDGSPRVGLGLYSTAAGAFITDFGLLFAGIAFYLWRTKAIDSVGRWALWAMLAFVIAMIPGTFLPGLWIVLPMLAMNLMLPFGNWIDRHRSLKPLILEKAI